MRQIFVTILFSALALTGCDKNPNDVAIDANLKAQSSLLKIEALEKRVSDLEQKQTEKRELPAQIQPAPAEAPKNKFMLIGPRTLVGSGTEFPSLQRCENARSSIIEQAVNRAERERARGIITLGEPQISCMPL